MTIRGRLVRAVLVSGGLVGVAASAMTFALYGAAHPIKVLKNRSLPLVNEAAAVADRAEDLSQSFDDLVDARYARDAAECARINTVITTRFEAMDAALQDLSRDGANAEGEIVAGGRELAVKMSRETDVLHRDWEALKNVSADSADFAQSLQLDDRASALMHSALAFQGRSLDEMGVRLAFSDRLITRAARFSILFSAALIACALLAGGQFADRLASRLDRVRAKAKAIGAGDLFAQVEVSGNDEIDQVSAAFNDMVRSLRASRGQLEHDALHDALTGLPNRALFLERLDRRVAEGKRHQDHDFAVLFLDLDRFKIVNDSLGHIAGDELLRAVSARLQQVIEDHGNHSATTNTVARLGGDEFVVLIEKLSDRDSEGDAVAIAKAIKVALAAPLIVEGHELAVTASIGIAVADPETADGKTVMSDADAALHRAKARGHDGHAVFDASMHTDVLLKLRMENDLRRAVEKDEFVLHFQPIVDLATEQLVGFESLVRWQREGELVRPDHFIPMAEETGQIVQIGEWVIGEACAQFQRWRRAYGGLPRMLSLNVSRRQMADPNLVPHLRRTLKATGLPPSTLIVEITESMLGDRGSVAEAVGAIRAMGVRVYVDDFGTGYSSLSCLNQFPVDGIKIDKSFVQNDVARRDQMAVLNSVVQLAHNLEIPVVAEGVETAEQLASLRAMGCDRGQGYYFAKPLPAADAEKLLSQPAARTMAAA